MADVPPSARTATTAEVGPAPAISDALAPGTVLAGRYEIVRELGRGAEAVVVEARDLRADAPIALKLIPELDLTPGRLARLRSELALARRITHPGVVRTHDWVDAAGHVGLAMELVHGETLRAALASARARGERPRAAQLHALASGLADALASAHAAGVVHRDLKPSNIILGSAASWAAPKITDFGIARALSDEAAPGERKDAAREGARGVVGTPRYMAPEQLAGETPGPAADVYALGLVLYEAAAGELPAAPADEGGPKESATQEKGRALDLAALLAARRERPRPLAALRPDLPRAFTAIVDRCLAPAPSARFADGAALAAALRASARPKAALRLGVALALALAAGGAALAVQRLRDDGTGPVTVPSAPSALVFARARHVVGQTVRLREVVSRTMRYEQPFARTVASVDEVVRTTTVLAAHDTTLLKVRVRYDLATHTQVEGGTATVEDQPVAGKTYVAEWTPGEADAAGAGATGLVITDAGYQPVSEAEAAIVRGHARGLGRPSPELAAVPDVPVKVGDRSDSLAELFKGSLLRRGALDAGDVEVELQSIARDGELDVGTFRLRLRGQEQSDGLTVAVDVGGRMILPATGRIRAVVIGGSLDIRGADVAGTGTIALTTEQQIGEG